MSYGMVARSPNAHIWHGYGDDIAAFSHRFISEHIGYVCVVHTLTLEHNETSNPASGDTMEAMKRICMIRPHPFAFVQR